MIIFKRAEIRLAVKLLGIFFLIVSGFSTLYFIVGIISPDNGLRFSEAAVKNFSDCLYFSVITITTLGYGDLTPIGLSRLIAAMEAVFGLTYVGYAISQVVSYRQEALINYLAEDRIFQTFDKCLADVSDAKELIADRRRMIQAGHAINAGDFFYFLGNPFYPVLRAMQALLGYCIHIETIGRSGELSERIERAAHHVEEISSFIRKLINIMNDANIPWKTDRVVMLLTEICELIDSFSIYVTKHTKYGHGGYKGKALYRDLIIRTTSDIRRALAGSTIKYRKRSNQGSTLRRLTRRSHDTR
jgi:hypothetical protein